MRISLLLDREPFGRIVSETLRDYWGARTGKAHHVEWHNHNPGARYFQRHSLQAWPGNIYLNFFAVSFAPEQAFAPLRQEYMRSVSLWRRWPQKFYVDVALSPRGRNRFSQCALAVWPGVYDAHDCVILGGNRRLRLLQPARRTTTVVLKKGFSCHHINEDVRLRLEAGPAFDCAPRIVGHSLAQGWYEEELVEGTPVNRLAPALSQMAIKAGHELLATQLVCPSLREQPVGTHVESIRLRIETVLGSVVESADGKGRVGALSEALRLIVAGLTGAGTTVATAATHGDLQPANLLWDGARVRIIDWENARHRLASYDMLFHAVGMTTRDDWSQVFIELLATPAAKLPAYRLDWPGLDWSVQGRKLTLAFFLLEELATVLEDDFEPIYFQPGQAFWPRLREFEKALRALRQS